MESELEIVGGYCLDMSVGMVVWLFGCSFCLLLLMRMSYVKTIGKHGEPMVESILQELGSFLSTCFPWILQMLCKYTYNIIQ